MQYELWTRLHADGATDDQLQRARDVLRRVTYLEMTPAILAPALRVLPAGVSVRTLDNLHLATMTFLRERGERVRLASYDARLVTAAVALGVEIEQV